MSKWADLAPFPQHGARDYQAEGENNKQALAGLASGTAGLPVDLYSLAHWGIQGSDGPNRPKDRIGGSNWLGEQMGANPNHPLFRMGSMGGFSDPWTRFGRMAGGIGLFSKLGKGEKADPTVLKAIQGGKSAPPPPPVINQIPGKQGNMYDELSQWLYPRAANQSRGIQIADDVAAKANQMNWTRPTEAQRLSGQMAMDVEMKRKLEIVHERMRKAGIDPSKAP